MWDHLEDSSLLEGFSTGFSYPSLSSSDYLPSGADGRNTAETDNQTPAPADEEIVSAADATETGQADVEEESIPATGRHPAVVPPVEEGGCRISCLFSKTAVTGSNQLILPFLYGESNLFLRGLTCKFLLFPNLATVSQKSPLSVGIRHFRCKLLVAGFFTGKGQPNPVVFEKAA